MEMEIRNKHYSGFTKGDFKIRAEGEAKYLEGYFAVFNQRTELWPGEFEEIAPGAFNKTLLTADVRCLFNHESGIVLGRTSSKTLILREDNHGLWGSVLVNPQDSAAMDVYARVQRGDISGCSFGFWPTAYEETQIPEGWLNRITEIELSEVSICTFPAYSATTAEARSLNRLERLHRTKGQLKQRLEVIKSCLKN